MAVIQANEAKLASGKSGEDWATAQDLTTSAVGYLHHYESFDPGISRDLLRVRGASSNSISGIKYLSESINVSMSGTLGYHDHIWHIIALLLGTAGSPSEQNGGESDFLHTLVSSSNILADYISMAYMVESDQVIEFPSVKPTSMVLSFVPNAVPTWTINGIASGFVYSGSSTPENTASDVNGLSLLSNSDSELERICIGGANHYLRYDAYSTSVSLSSADDKKILGCEITFTRPMVEDRPLRAGSTPNTVEPVQPDNTQCTVRLDYDRIDDSEQDVMADYKADTYKAMELFVDGQTINSGDPASLKIQIPRMKMAQPSGYASVRGQKMRSGALYEATVPPTVQSGMTSATDLIAIELVNTWAPDYLA